MKSKVKMNSLNALLFSKRFKKKHSLKNYVFGLGQNETYTNEFLNREYKFREEQIEKKIIELGAYIEKFYNKSNNKICANFIFTLDNYRCILKVNKPNINKVVIYCIQNDMKAINMVLNSKFESFVTSKTNTLKKKILKKILSK